MIDYTNQVDDPIQYIRQATFNDITKYKPHFTKIIATCAGQTRIRINPTGHKYWLYTCILCNKTNIIRQDRVNKFKCRCVKHKKRPRKPRTKKIQPDNKKCPICGKTYPLTIKHFYQSKRGYFGTYCKTCDCGRHIPDKYFGRNIHYTRDDCGRPIDS